MWSENWTPHVLAHKQCGKRKDGFASEGWAVRCDAFSGSRFFSCHIPHEKKKTKFISLPVNNFKFGYSPGNLLALYIPPDETCFFVHLLFGLHFKTDCSLIYLVCSLQFVFTLTVKSYENCHFLEVSQNPLLLIVII